MTRTNLSRLMRCIGYDFKNPLYLQQALTHRSASKLNNERLEFIGDTLLSTIISMDLFTRLPAMSEGELTRLRANLVCGDTLACIANEIHLGDYLILGPGELKSGGFRRASILADALEALIAAVFLDGGLPACEHVVSTLYQTRFTNDLETLQHKDDKTRLQEYLQAHQHPLPQYTLISCDESELTPVFHIRGQVTSLNLIETATGETRRKAEQHVAKKLLARIHNA